MNIFKPTLKSASLFMAGMGSALILIVGIWQITTLLTTQVKLSCHTPSQPIEETQYCVYHTKSYGLLSGNNYSLHIGLGSDRGLNYDIPYSASDISVKWDKGTDQLTIVMPGSQLLIDKKEYIDTR